MEHEGPQVVRIALDGSYGAGPDAEFTIVTKAEDGRQIETSYTVPYYCLDLPRIQKMSDMNFILGFRLVQSASQSAAGLRELGL